MSAGTTYRTDKDQRKDVISQFAWKGIEAICKRRMNDAAFDVVVIGVLCASRRYTARYLPFRGYLRSW